MKVIFPIIYIFILISLLVGGLTIFYIKKVKMKDETARKVEIFGYATLFCVIIWEYAIKNVLMGDFYTSDYYINEKINTLFFSLNSFINRNADNVRYFSLFSDLMNGEGDKFISIQLRCVDTIEMLLQIISTVCIAIGRFQELLNKKSDEIVE